VDSWHDAYVNEMKGRSHYAVIELIESSDNVHTVRAGPHVCAHSVNGVIQGKGEKGRKGIGRGKRGREGDGRLASHTILGPGVIAFSDGFGL